MPQIVKFEINNIRFSQCSFPIRAYIKRRILGLNLPLSSHCVPSLHLHTSLNQRHVCHMEFFHDHERLEEMFFEGVPKLIKGCLYPDLDRFGHGLELKEKTYKKILEYFIFKLI